MYRTYKETSAIPVKQTIYRKVFLDMKPPLKFHKLIKDQYDKCKAGTLNDEDMTAMRGHFEKKKVTSSTKATKRK